MPGKLTPRRYNALTNAFLKSFWVPQRIYNIAGLRERLGHRDRTCGDLDFRPQYREVSIRINLLNRRGHFGRTELQEGLSRPHNVRICNNATTLNKERRPQRNRLALIVRDKYKQDAVGKL